MKNIITGLFALFVINSAFAQGNFEVGTNVIGAGIGIGSSYGSGYGGTQTPAINLQFEHGMWEAGGPGVISLGGYFAYKSFKYDYLSYNSKWNYMIIGVRSAYHYNGIQSDKFDVYGGLMLGLRSISFTNDEPGYAYDYGGSDIILFGFVGGRYYFNQNFGAFAELGNGIAVLNLGVVYKL